MNDKNKKERGTEPRVFLGAYDLSDALKKYNQDVIAKVLAKELNSKIATAIQAPIKCVLWEHPERVEGLPFKQIKRYVDDSHYIRDLLQCPECGQLYFKEFLEEVDWLNGDDPQYRTYVPVVSEAEADELNTLNSFELLNRSPQLHYDWPSGKPKTIYWSR